MRTDESTGSTPLTPQLRYALRYYLGNRKVLIALAVVALLGGMILNWNWLAAAGLAPIILALAPCAAMCAAGLCMNKMGQKSCDSQASTGDDPASKVSSAPEAHETQALPSTTSTTVEPSSSAASSKVRAEPAHPVSLNPSTAKEKYDA